MAEMHASIILVLIIAFCFLFSKLIELHRVNSLRDLVAWSVTGGGGLPLWCEISNAQNECELSKEYCIDRDEEWAYVKEIINEYKEDLMRSYFKKNLYVIKSKYAIRGRDYFMFALYAFLSDHQCDYKFIEKDMHKETLEYKRYGDWGGPLYDATYELTGFAIVFHKMHYITYMYCRRSDILKSFVPAWNEENLKKILDTNQIQISRY